MPSFESVRLATSAATAGRSMGLPKLAGSVCMGTTPLEGAMVASSLSLLLQLLSGPLAVPSLNLMPLHPSASFK